MPKFAFGFCDKIEVCELLLRLVLSRYYVLFYSTNIIRVPSALNGSKAKYRNSNFRYINQIETDIWSLWT